MSRKKSNNEKILEILKPLDKEITTTELADKTNINIKNITRYLKDLENKDLITRNTIQKGKIRVVLIKFGRKEKPKSIPIKKIVSKPIIKPESQIKTKIDFSSIQLTQDDLWAFHIFLTRKTTRKSKKELIPKFIELLKKNL